MAKKPVLGELEIYYVPSTAYKQAEHTRNQLVKTRAGKWRVGQQVVGMGAKPPSTALLPTGGGTFDAAVWPPLLETREEKEFRRNPVVSDSLMPRDLRVRNFVHDEPSEAFKPRAAATWNFARGNASSLAAASSMACAPGGGGLERALEEARAVMVQPRPQPVELTWHFAKPNLSSPAAANSTAEPPATMSRKVSRWERFVQY